MSKTELSKLHHLAIRSGSTRLVLEIKNNMDFVNARDSDGNSLVILAVRYRNLDLLQTFLEWGVPADITNKNGETALQLAELNSLTQFADTIQSQKNQHSENISGDMSSPTPDEFVDSKISSQVTDAIENPRFTYPYMDVGMALKETKPESQHHIGLVAKLSNKFEARPANATTIEVEPEFPDNDPMFLDIASWQSEEEVLRPENDTSLLLKVEKISSALQKFRPIQDNSESWASLEIDLPSSDSNSRSPSSKYAKLSKYLAKFSNHNGILQKRVFYEFIDSLEDNQKPDFSIIEWEHKLELLGIDFENLEVEPKSKLGELSRPDASHWVTAILAEDYLLSERWITRIFEQAAKREVLTREAEVEVAIRMEGALLSLRRLFNSPSCSEIKSLLEEAIYSDRTTNKIDDEPMDTGSTSIDEDESSPDPESELATDEPLNFITFLVIQDEPEAGKLPSPSLEELNYLRSTLTETSPDLVSEFDLLVNRYIQSKEKFFSSNIRLAYSIAKRYPKSVSMELEDLVQHSFIGLLKAISRWDYTLGYKFSTYATWWIRQSITRAIADFSRQIRIPAHLQEKLNRLRKEVEPYEIRGEQPPREVLAEKLEMSEDAIRTLSEVNATYVEINTNVECPPSAFSPNPSTEDLFEEFSSERRKFYVAKALEHLKEREKFVVIKRFGLLEDDSHTLEEVGQILGVTRERIRQIEVKAIKQLRGRGCSFYFDGEEVYLRYIAEATKLYVNRENHIAEDIS